jgi:nicotinamidase-related amidase
MDIAGFSERQRRGVQGRVISPAPALIIIDVQKAIDDPRWARYGPRNNPSAERNIARLLDACRSCSLPIYHVRHDSTEPESTYRPNQPGNEFKPEAAPRPGETVVVKHTNSAFIATDLEARLRRAGHMTLLLCGVITNNSVEATARMAGNLGFKTYLVEDACFTFARPDWHGLPRTAEEVHAMSLANLHGEYCTVITTAEAIGQFIPAVSRTADPGSAA